MSCKPTYKGVRYNSLEELYNANGVNEQQKQQAQQLYSQYLSQNPNGTVEQFKSRVDNNQSISLTDDEIGVVKETIIKRLLKDEENSEKSITFAEIDKSLEGRLSDALKGSSKTPEELWINFSSEGKVQLIDCL